MNCLGQISAESMNLSIWAESYNTLPTAETEKWFKTVYSTEGMSFAPASWLNWSKWAFVSVKESLRTTARFPNVVFTHKPAAERCVHR